MGLNLGCRDSVDFSRTPVTPEPNPRRFNIRKREDVNGRSILLVYYPGCTTFEGMKLILLHGLWNGGAWLDPHFVPESPQRVMARFEPTEQGWTLARLCAESDMQRMPWD